MLYYIDIFHQLFFLVTSAEVSPEVAGVTSRGTSIETPLLLLFLEWQTQWSFIKLICSWDE